MKRLFPLVLAGLGGAGGGDDTIGDASGDIVVSPETLVFPNAYVGHPITAGVTVQNTGRAPASLSARTAAPFALAAPPSALRGAETLTLEVTFTPEAPGPAAGTLRIDAGGRRFEVALSATAYPAPSCTTAEACRVAWFDPESGSCVSERADDGTSCSSHCVAGGTCLEGQCRGASDGCDDGDPCTRDLLAADCTCRHEPVPERPTDDPCRTERCVPGVGWEVTKVADGTACGPVNECTGQFCADGVCGAASEAPVGTVCEAGTPCRKPRRCERRGDGVLACLPAGGNPVTTLAPVWRVTPTGGRQIRYEAVADDRYLYWAECDASGCGLRSVSPIVHPTSAPGAIDPDPAEDDYEAFDRWDGTMPMFAGEVAPDGGLALSRGLVFSTLRKGWVEAYHAESGEPAFRLDLERQEARGRGATAINGFGDLVLLVADGPDVAPRTVLAVSPAGTVVWEHRRNTELLHGLIADEDGNVFFAAEGNDASRLVSLDGSGRERFAVLAPPVAPLAVHGGRLLHGDGRRYTTASGWRIGEPLGVQVPATVLPPVLGPDVGWLAGYLERDGEPQWTEFGLFGFLQENGQNSVWLELSSQSAPWERSEPLLLDNRRLLVAEGGAAFPPRLFETWGGPAEWSCALAPGAYGGPATVLSSLWITHDASRGSVAAFLLEVAGQAPRSLGGQGWLGGGGEPGRGNRPLP